MGKSADILNMDEARAKRLDFSKNTGFDTAGAFLQSVREEKGLSIEEISVETHIREDHLRAIESGDLSVLPPRAYVSGFVKTYATHLELDPAPIVIRFKEDVGLLAPPKIDASKFESADSYEASQTREMSLIAVIAILAFILWCAWQIMAPDSQEAQIVNARAVPEGFPPPAIAPGDPAIIDPLAEIAPAALGANDTVARVIDRVDPVYPRFCEARAKPLESVETSFTITRDGRVSAVRILSSTSDCFEESAVNALKRWRFEPRLVEGKPQPAYDQVITLVFRKPA